MKTLSGVFLVRTAVEPRVSWRDVRQDGFDVDSDGDFALRNGRVRTTPQTSGQRQSVQRYSGKSENVEEGMARWTTPVGVERCTSVVTA